MWIVLCASDDPAGLWAYLGLGRRGLAPLELVTPEALGWAVSWEHRLGRNGVETEIGLADGRRLSHREVRGVLNRLPGVSESTTAAFRREDRAYVLQELHALHLSWLDALPVPVLNRPSPQCLSGWRPSPWEWSALAARAGLATLPRHESSRQPAGAFATVAPSRLPPRRLLVVGEGVRGSHGLPPGTAEACRRLARLAGLDLLQVDLLPEGRGGGWAFAGAEVLPDLRRWGEPVMDDLLGALGAAEGLPTGAVPGGDPEAAAGRPSLPTGTAGASPRRTGATP